MKRMKSPTLLVTADREKIPGRGSVSERTKRGAGKSRENTDDGGQRGYRGNKRDKSHAETREGKERDRRSGKESGEEGGAARGGRRRTKVVGGKVWGGKLELFLPYFAHVGCLDLE